MKAPTAPRNWQRYDLGGASKLSFEEGVDSYVPYAGPLADGVQTTLYKVKEHHVQLRLQTPFPSCRRMPS